MLPRYSTRVLLVVLERDTFAEASNHIPVARLDSMLIGGR
jgi:hypothetical protein